ncbi:MAG: toll/interleukin-1 receptor domain-containing protein [Thermodesulfovibrionales bacterium]
MAQNETRKRKPWLDIFADDGSVFVGDDPQKMIDEVKRSVIFMPVLSNESIRKEFVQNEIRTAFANKTTHIFPIRLKCDDASIPEGFKTNFTACDRFEGKIYEDFSDEQNWGIHYENLRRAIFNKIVELGLFKRTPKIIIRIANTLT